MEKIIYTENLSLTYGLNTPFEKCAVKDLNISIYKGEFLGIIGHTGSGKSSLVQMLNGLIKPTSGKIFLESKDINADKKNLRNVRFKVGIAFQYPEYQLFEETVYKDIAFGPMNKGVSGKELELCVQKAAGFTGLNKELLDKSPFELSGGEKRRAAISGIIAMNPDVLILDEPTAGLDPQGREKLLYQINDYHKKEGNTIILVSHSMEDIAKYADRILVMNKGICEMLDSTEKVFSQSEKLSEMGLRVPQITQIIQKLYSKGIGVSPDILTVQDAEIELSKLLKKGGDLK